MLHPARTQADWLRAARHEDGVQAVVPQLDLRTADEVWAPNRRVATRLERIGFEQIVVRKFNRD